MALATRAASGAPHPAAIRSTGSAPQNSLPPAGGGSPTRSSSYGPRCPTGTHPNPPDPRDTSSVELEVLLTKTQLLGIVTGDGLDGTEHTGDPAALDRLL